MTDAPPGILMFTLLNDLDLNDGLGIQSPLTQTVSVYCLLYLSVCETYLRTVFTIYLKNAIYTLTQ